MGLTEKENEELEGFREIVEERAEDHPRWADVRYRQGLACVEAGDLDRAREAFAVALEVNPHYRDARISAASLAARQHATADADTHLRALHKEHPNDWRAVLGLARGLATLGRTTAALDALGRLPRAEFKRPQIIYARAVLLERAGDSQAKPVWTTAERLYPKLAAFAREQALSAEAPQGELRRRMAQFLVEMREHGRAKGWLMRALRTDLDLAAHRFAQGEMRFAVGSLQGACERFEEAIVLDPDAVKPRVQCAYVLAMLNRVDPAIEHIQTALKAYPQYPDLHQQLGELLSSRNDLEGATRSFERSVELNELNPDALYALGLLKAGMGDDATACRSMQRALELGLDTDDLRLELGFAEVASGNVARARELLESVRGKPGMEAADLGLSLLADTDADVAETRKALAEMAKEAAWESGIAALDGIDARRKSAARALARRVNDD